MGGVFWTSWLASQNILGYNSPIKPQTAQIFGSICAGGPISLSERGSAMASHKLTFIKTLSAPKHSIIYLASDGEQFFAVKTPRESSPELFEAYQDEYDTLKNICHPTIPRYYGFLPALQMGSSPPVPALIMEHIDGVLLWSMDYLTTKQLKKYILDLGGCLLRLLSHGILYTDLHPGNLLVKDGCLKLIDFTCAYYFLKNPYPSYTPKISYHLNPNLKAQQLLIQEMAYLLCHLPEAGFPVGIPASLLAFGKNPDSSIDFAEFLLALDRKWKI